MVGDAVFGVEQAWEGEVGVAADGDGGEFLLADETGDGGVDSGVGGADECGGGAFEIGCGECGVAVVGGGGFEGVEDGGAEAAGVVAGDAEVGGDLVGGFEADAVDVFGELVGVVVEDVDGAGAVVFVDADGAGGGDFVVVEEEHDFADALLLFPGGFDFFAALAADAVDFFEPLGGGVDDVEGAGAEFGDDFFGVDGTDAFDEAGAEVAGDGVGGIWCGGFDGFGFELAAVVRVVGPGAGGLDGFAGGDGGGVADDGDGFGVVGEGGFEDGVAGFFVEEDDAVDGGGHSGFGRKGCEAGFWRN